MARILKPMVRGGGWYPSKKWIPLVKNGGYTTQNGGETEPVWATVSGAIASFTTPFAYPLKSLVAQINPVQDLHGYANPWPAGGGKNKGYISPDNIYSQQNCSYTFKNGGVVATSTGNYGRVGFSFPVVIGETYTVSANCKRGESTVYKVGLGSTSNWDSEYGTLVVNPNVTTTLTQFTKTITATTSTLYVEVYPSSNVGAEITIENFQCELGSSATSYAPYSNICPISGWTGLEGQRTGANILECTVQTQAGITGSKNADGTFHIEGTATAASYPVNFKMMTLKAGTYVYSVSELPSGVSAQFALNGSWAGVITQGKTITIADGDVLTGYVNVTSGTTVNADIAIQLEVGSVASGTIEPYTGEAISVTFPTTVYGGTDEVVGGNGTSTMGMVDLGTLDWSYWNGIFYVVISDKAMTNQQCDIISSSYKSNAQNFDNASSAKTYMNDYEIAGYYGTGSSWVYLKDPRYTTVTALKADMSSTQLCYELATPTTFTHDPQEVDTLVGQNNVFVDTGSVEVTYRIG